MQLFRGENLGEKDYVQSIQQVRKETLELLLKETQKQIQKNKLKIEKILASNSNLAFEYNLLKKNVSDLTKEEREYIINKADYMGLIEGNFSEFSNADIQKYIQQLVLNLSDEHPFMIEKANESMIENLDGAKKEYKQFNIALDKRFITREIVDNIKKYIELAKSKGIEASVVIDYAIVDEKTVNYSYSKEEMNLLNEINNCLLNNGYKSLNFHEVGRCESTRDNGGWSFEQVVHANTRIDNMVDKIKSLNLSPFEAMLYIHEAVSKFTYKAKGVGEESRVLPSILNSTEIVCVGYSSLVKVIIDKLNMPGLKCDYKDCALLDKKGRVELHQHNLVHIDDDKYNIHGHYINDACWDSRVEGESYTKGFAHCLYPISNVNHIKGLIYADGAPMKSQGDVIRIFFTYNLSDKYENWIKRKINQIKYRKDFQKTTELIKQYGEGEPIDIEKYRMALTEIYSFKNSEEDALNRANQMIERSIKNSKETFKSSANNTFRKEKSTLKTERKMR